MEDEDATKRADNEDDLVAVAATAERDIPGQMEAPRTKDPASCKDAITMSSGTQGLSTSVCLLELAADDDLAGFREAVESGRARIDEVGTWYCRQSGSGQMLLERRTPAMIAALYGSIEVLKYILSIYKVCGADVNYRCGSSGSSALHCAASGGSANAVETASLLLRFGADKEAVDVQGRTPGDVIAVSPKVQHIKVELERLLKGSASLPSSGTLLISGPASTTSPVDSSPALSPSASPPPSLDGISKCSPSSSVASEENYGIADASLPDIKNSIYSTDEFRMYSFKVRPCSRAYSHDWTECPFVHPGENARRRDPRRFHYSCVPCPDFRKGSCRRGDACEYAHGVFECWLHPAQYRTRLCKDGPGCARRVCFFAHLPEELRPVYLATGSGLPPVTSTCATIVETRPPSPPLPQSPQSVLVTAGATYSPIGSPGAFATPPHSPSPSSPRVGARHHLAAAWSHSSSQSVPSVHLPNSNQAQASRLRAALNARDLQVQEAVSPYAPMSPEQLASSLEDLSMAAGNFGTSGMFSASSNLTPRLGQIAVKNHANLKLQTSGLDEYYSAPCSPGGQWNKQLQATGSPMALKTRYSDMDLMSASLPRSSVLTKTLHVRRNSFSTTQDRERSSTSALFMSGSPPATSTTSWGSPSGKPDWATEMYLGRASAAGSTSLGASSSRSICDMSEAESIWLKQPSASTMASTRADLMRELPLGHGVEDSRARMDRLAAAVQDRRLDLGGPLGGTQMDNFDWAL